jgi:hypothetical protein
MWFWWMRVEQGLTRRWNYGDGLWRRTLEVIDFRLRYMKYDFSVITQEEGDVRRDG